jgi:Uma2 family endonuclease
MLHMRGPLPMTEEDFLDLADIDARVELFDGSLFTSSVFTPRHQMVGRNLANALDVDASLTVFTGVAVRLQPGRIAVPDVVLTDEVDYDRPFVEARSVRLVAEVLSPSTETVDRVLKRHFYAAAGIPYYLVMDPETGVLELDGRSARPGETLSLTEPVEVNLTLDELLSLF